MKGKVKQFMVLGMGLFGSSLAKALHELGHEVLAVDADADLVEAIAPYVTQAVQIDATDEAALQELGCAQFRRRGRLHRQKTCATASSSA